MGGIEDNGAFLKTDENYFYALGEDDSNLPPKENWDLIDGSGDPPKLTIIGTKFVVTWKIILVLYRYYPSWNR